MGLRGDYLVLVLVGMGERVFSCLFSCFRAFFHYSEVLMIFGLGFGRSWFLGLGVCGSWVGGKLNFIFLW